MPSQDPDNLNVQTELGRKFCEDFRDLFLKGLAATVPKTLNISKAFGHPQKKDETPMEYLERLKIGMRQYTGLDPEADENAAVLKLQFISGSYPDIQKKLQKVEGLVDKPIQTLVAEAQKVMVRREQDKEKRKVNLMVQTVREVTKKETGKVQDRRGAGWQRERGGGQRGMRRGGGRGFLPRDVCAKCRRPGHWKRECPERRGAEEQRAYLQALQFEDGE